MKNMKAGEKATYTVYLTDRIVKERMIPYKSFEVNFEAVESGAFQYGNQTTTVWVDDSGHSHHVDTRYWVGTFDKCCRQILDDYYGRNIEKVERHDHYIGEIVQHKGHECEVTIVWADDQGRHGITIQPTGNYGFPIDIYDDQL